MARDITERFGPTEQAPLSEPPRSSWPPGPALPRLVIENVTPELDGGRHAVKRLIGDVVAVGADIYKDGHDAIAARVLFRGPGDTAFQSRFLEYEFNPDRWYGGFEVDRVGLWQFTIEAWPNRFLSWRNDLQKRAAAGQDLGTELLEGANLLEHAAKRAPLAAVGRLKEAARLLADAALPNGDRLRVALEEDLIELARLPLEPSEATRYDRLLEIVVDPKIAGFAAWYELFPRSQASTAHRTPADGAGVHGTFADVEKRLPALRELGFDVLYFPPVHPIGVTHRKGKNNSRTAEPGDVGSPWGIGSMEGGHTTVHPELGTLADFDRLVARAREHGLEIALDYALQCSPDHPWVRDHPEWFFIRQDGTIRYAENPPKKYEDIYPLNFWCADREGLWSACRDVLLFWISHGVRIFRVDNPHTKPLVFWQWVIREVKSAHPDAVFLSEAFTRPKRMKGLAKLGFTQSYTYFTWKNTSRELVEYLTELTKTEMVEYYRPNFFANTPDILHEYLQRGGRPAFRVRLLLAATLSPIYGIYSGFELCENVPLHAGSEEYLHSEKYEIRTRSFGVPESIERDVALLNRIRRENPALQRLDNLEFLATGYEEILAYRKSTTLQDLIIVVNLNPFAIHETMISTPLDALGIAESEPFEVEDLLTEERYVWRGRYNYVKLDPAHRVGHVLRVIRRR